MTSSDVFFENLDASVPTNAYNFTFKSLFHSRIYISLKNIVSKS